MLQRINLTDDPRQSFSITANGKRIEFEFAYNSFSDRFAVSIKINDAYVIQGRILQENVDILQSFPGEDISLVGKLFCVDVAEKGNEPTLENIANGLSRVFIKT